MTMLTPDDPGTGRLFFWTRQGISLQQLYDIIAEVVAAGGGTSTPPTGGGTIDGQIDPVNIIGSTDVGIGVLTASGATFADRQQFARDTIGAVGVNDVPSLVGGKLQWSQMPSNTVVFMDSPSGAMVPRVTTRDDVVGVWRFPASSPPSLGGGSNAHDGDEWWVEISA